MGQLGNRMFCSTNKKTVGLMGQLENSKFFMSQLGNPMICSTNKRTAGF